MFAHLLFKEPAVTLATSWRQFQRPAGVCLRVLHSLQAHVEVESETYTKILTSSAHSLKDQGSSAYATWTRLVWNRFIENWVSGPSQNLQSAEWSPTWGEIPMSSVVSDKTSALSSQTLTTHLAVHTTSLNNHTKWWTLVSSAEGILWKVPLLCKIKLNNEKWSSLRAAKVGATAGGPEYRGHTIGFPEAAKVAHRAPHTATRFPRWYETNDCFWTYIIQLLERVEKM